MAIQVKHSFTSVVIDAGEAGIVGPDRWNENHIIVMATDRLLGRTTAGDGEVEEITIGAGLTLATGILANTDRGSVAVTAHLSGGSNPHGTTASDVGADPAGSATSAQTYAVQRSNHTGTQLASTISDFGTAVEAVAMIRIAHGATAGTARPSGAAAVEWVGSVTPSNAVNGDTWINTT